MAIAILSSWIQKSPYLVESVELGRFNGLHLTKNQLHKIGR